MVVYTSGVLKEIWYVISVCNHDRGRGVILEIMTRTPGKQIQHKTISHFYPRFRISPFFVPYHRKHNFLKDGTTIESKNTFP